MATAKHRAIDLIRRRDTYARKLAEVGHSLEDVPPPEPSGADDIDDDLLRLIFTACHPLLSPEARIALTLRLLGGLTTEEIARAYLAAEPTVAQRIVRAKRTLARAGVPFEVPSGLDRTERLSSVLEVIYLIFNEGYSATAGDHLLRPALCEDALRLARVLGGKYTAWPRCWSSRPRAWRPAPVPTASRSCWPISTGTGGTGCSSAAASRPSSAPVTAPIRSRPPSPPATPGP